MDYLLNKHTVTNKESHLKEDTEDCYNGVMTLDLDQFQRVLSLIQYGFVDT